MDFIKYIALIGYVLISASSLCILSLKKAPEWVPNSRLESSWKKINIVSLVGALFSSGLIFCIYSHFSFEYMALSVIGVSLASFICIQAFFTDVTLRLADRRLFYLAILFTAPISVWFMLKFSDQSEILLFIILIFASSATIFFLVGQSDGRAFLLSTLAFFPILGFKNFVIGFAVVASFMILYWIFEVIIRKKKEMGVLLSTVKVSLPAVPLILSGFILVTVFSPIFS